MNDPTNTSHAKITQVASRGHSVTIPRNGEPTAHEDQRGRAPGGGDEWPAETEQRLAALWETDLSCADIARQLGRSKNAVVGKSHRLGLPMRPSPIRPAGTGARPHERADRAARAERARLIASGATLPPLASADAKPAPKPKRKSPRANLPPPPPRVLDHGRLGGTQRSPRHTLAPAPVPVRAAPPPRPVAPPRACAWPLSAGRPWRFCEAESEPGKPYCPDHCLLSYPQRRAREEADA